MSAHIRMMNVTEAVAYARELGYRVVPQVGVRGRYNVVLNQLDDGRDQYAVICTGKRTDDLTNAGAALVQHVLPHWMNKTLRWRGGVLGSLPEKLVEVMEQAPEYLEHAPKRKALARALALALRDIFPTVADALSVEATE